MSHSFYRYRMPVATVSVAVLAVTTALVGATPAHSIPADPACPDAFPVADLAKGQPVDGLTVSSGNVPDEFTGEVLGVVDDGIAPDLDMIMVRLTSTEIDRVGGTWAGMSGSPVYAADGRLIGAVAYGLAFGPSPVAGVTPAEEMKRLLGDPDAPALSRARMVDLPARMQQRLVAEGDATEAQADSGMRPLPVPVGISGMLDSTRLAKATQRLGLKDAQYFRAGGAATAAGDPGEIFAGSNLAASLSYGDFSAVGTGTTTMVCDGKAVAFGHPFAFAGQTSLTMHAADAVYVQEDPTLFPFKVSNASGPVGTISQDRLSGISGLLGIEHLPETALVHHELTLATGRTRSGDTHVSVPDFLPDATFLAQLVNQDRLMDRIGRGSSRVHFTVTGTTRQGEPFTLVRTNRYASGFDVSVESAFEAADMVFALTENEFTDIDIDDVRFNTTMSSANRFFRVGRVEQKVGTSYRTLGQRSVVRAKPGRRVILRVTLNSYRNNFGTKRIQIATRVPADASPGTFGSVTVGARGFDEEFEGAATTEPKSFDGLLAQLASSPRNDQLGLTLDLSSEEDGTGVSQEAVRQAFDVVRGSRFFDFRVAR
jgi:hypothetical protein